MSLRWKLTLSYTLVTTAAILLVELVALLVAVYLLTSPDTLATVLVPVLTEAASDLAPALSEQPPDQAQARAWLTTLVRTGQIPSSAQRNRNFRLEIEPLYLRGALLIGADGRVL
ncbi:MAG: hypothetical protein GXO36_04980, partial [Chloroflexi bacterium]|nr:hypothetical protein [Chloroflexota bacterium]